MKEKREMKRKWWNGMKAPLVKTFRKSFPQKVTLVLRRKLRRNQERPRDRAAEAEGRCHEDLEQKSLSGSLAWLRLSAGKLRQACNHGELGNRVRTLGFILSVTGDCWRD